MRMHDAILGIASFLSRVAFEGARCYYYAKAQSKKVREAREIAKAHRQGVGTQTVTRKWDTWRQTDTQAQDAKGQEASGN